MIGRKIIPKGALWIIEPHTDEDIANKCTHYAAGRYNGRIKRVVVQAAQVWDSVGQIGDSRPPTRRGAKYVARPVSSFVSR